MPYRCHCFELVVNYFESTGQHARTAYKLQIGNETRQIIEGQHDTPHSAGSAIAVGRSEQVVNVHRYADQRKISQETRVQN